VENYFDVQGTIPDIMYESDLFSIIPKPTFDYFLRKLR
jgi:hypothetical protein